ncbi:hypothetical protein F5Y17DRAFT_416690 [Xylariaceae sp. FL0594]|nr:hypothetical protein F5Y17DRAFT_416690 [Xylariaceae sp. FL0594]
MYGDISFLEGCDGGGKISATDGSLKTRGCVRNLLKGAPVEAIVKRATGNKTLAPVTGNKANKAALAWELLKCDKHQVWITPKSDGQVIFSDNGRMEIFFDKGRP